MSGEKVYYFIIQITKLAFILKGTESFSDWSKSTKNVTNTPISLFVALAQVLKKRILTGPRGHLMLFVTC